MNPCRCGYLAELACGRAPRCAEDYQGRLSGPLLDRIDLHIDVPAVPSGDLTLPPPTEGSAAVARRVAAARARQAARYGALSQGQRIRTNAEADGVLLDQIASPEAGGRALLLRAADRLRLSARGYHRVLRVARTLADLEGSSSVGRRHVAEALSYRRLPALPDSALRA
jgi:magnesium chelatase family protein